jgi:two-component system, cell cycle sensor histidine kinase and response regulator CckA
MYSTNVQRQAGDALPSLNQSQEETLRANEVRTQLLIQAANVGLWDWDLKTNQVYFSPEWKMQLGYREHELSNRYEEWESRLHPFDRSAALAAVEEFRSGVRTNYDVEFRLRHKDGSWRWICARADFQRDASGEPIRIMGCHLDITDRKNADAAKIEALERLEKIASRVPGVVYQLRLRPDGLFAFPYVSDGMRSLFGLSPEEVLEDASRVFAIYHPDDIEALGAAIEKSAKNLTPWSHEFRLKFPDGTIRWVQGNSIPEREDDGSILWHGYIADVTDRKLAEQALQESEGRWRFALEGGRDGVWDWNIPENTVSYSRRWKEMLGFADDEIGNDLEDWKRQIHPDDLDQVMADIRAHLEGTSSHYSNEHRARCKDGTWRWMQDRGLVISRNAAGQPLRMIGTYSDITEHKLAEAALRDSRALQTNADSLRIVTNSARVGLVVLNKEHRYVFANSSYSAIFGLTEDLVGQHIADVFPAAYKERIKPRLDRAFAGKRMDYEIRLPTSGAPIHCAVNYEPVRENDEVTSVAIVVMDITAQRNTEEQLRQSQKMEAIGQLAGGVAHDFNNILTIISGFTNLLLKKITAEDQAWNYLNEIRIASARAADLTRSLLAYSHQQIRSPESMNLNEVITETLKLLQRSIGEGIKIHVSLESGLKPVWMDRSELSQILLNLSINARDAMEGQGELSIQTRNVDISSEAAGGKISSPGNYVLLTVTDSGTGMTDEVQSRIFEPFFTTKPIGKGTGLGLAMVHGIVSRSRGSIQVTSSIGQGTTFEILLPQSNDTIELDPFAMDAQRSVHGTETILLVEDDNAVRGLSSTVLAEHGFKVLEASDGNEAVQTFIKRRDQVQIVITDVVMPGMNGATLVEQILQLAPDTPILFISGYIGEAATRDRLGDRNVNFLQKPFEPNKLVLKVREVLDQRLSKRRASE